MGLRHPGGWQVLAGLRKACPTQGRTHSVLAGIPSSRTFSHSAPTFCCLVGRLQQGPVSPSQRGRAVVPIRAPASCWGLLPCRASLLHS